MAFILSAICYFTKVAWFGKVPLLTPLGNWRGVRAAEGARLESVYTLTRIEGSNPSLSAIF